MGTESQKYLITVSSKPDSISLLSNTPSKCHGALSLGYPCLGHSQRAAVQNAHGQRQLQDLQRWRVPWRLNTRCQETRPTRPSSLVTRLLPLRWGTMLTEAHAPGPPGMVPVLMRTRWKAAGTITGLHETALPGSF